MAKYNHGMNPSKIIGIQFSVLSPEEIRKGSVAEITSRDTYINNKPVISGLFDPRMGVLEPGINLSNRRSQLYENSRIFRSY